MGFKRSARPESIRKDPDEVKTIVGRGMDRLMALAFFDYARARSRAERENILRGVAFGLFIMEGTLVKDLTKSYYTHEFIIKLKTRMRNGEILFTILELGTWYKLMASKSQSIMPLPKSVLVDDTEPEEGWAQGI